MSTKQIINAWRNPESNNYSRRKRHITLPENPAGILELSESQITEMDSAVSMCTRTCADCNSLNTVTCDPCCCR